MKNITTYLTIIGLVLNIILIYSLYTLPNRIKEINNISTKEEKK